MAGSTISPSMPVFSASRAKRHASAVVYSATPDSTGILPRTACLISRSTSSFSAYSSAVFSPTVPSMTTP